MATTISVFTSMSRCAQEYNLKYVDLIEEQLNEALTTYRKPVDGDNYVRRSNQRQDIGPDSSDRAGVGALDPIAVVCNQTSLRLATGYKDQMSIFLFTCMASWSTIRRAATCWRLR